MSRLRVCLVALAPYPGIYLPEVRNIRDELLALGHELVIIAANAHAQRPTYTKEGAIEVYTLPTRNRLQTELFFTRAALRIRKLQPDVTHIVWRFGAGIVPMLTRGIPAIMDIRTGSISNTRWRRLLENGLMWLEQYCFRAVTIVDEPLAHKLHIHADAYIPQGVPSFMLDAQPSAADITRAREAMGAKPSSMLGVFVGTSYLRNLETLIKGFYTAHEQEPDLHLAIIGDAAERPELQSLVAEAPGGCVRLLPNIPNQSLPPYLAGAAFGVSYVPITPGFTYQQSTKIPQFFAFNLPVLATATQANQHFISDGKNGVLIRDTEQDVCEGFLRLHALAKNPKWRQEVGNVNAHWLTAYSWRNIVAHQLVPLYRQLTHA